MAEGKKILLIIAPENFRDEEYFETKEVLESRGSQVTTASARTGKIKGMLGGTASPDITLDSVKTEEYDAVVFIGGSGAQAYFDNSKVLSIAREASSKGKVLGAICIAPVILANAGLLEGKKATVFNGRFKDKLEQGGAQFTGEPVTRDGKIITANGPDAARDFGSEIAKALEV